MPPLPASVSLSFLSRVPLRHMSPLLSRVPSPVTCPLSCHVSPLLSHVPSPVTCPLCSKVQFVEGMNEVDLVLEDGEGQEGEGKGSKEKNYFARSLSVRLGVDQIDAYSDFDFK